MNKIASFTVNHLKLNCGLYVSRIDNFDGVTLTTFDMRFTAPNKEEVISEEEALTFKDRKEVINMKPFPSKDSIKFVDDTLIIKLSE